MRPKTNLVVVILASAAVMLPTAVAGQGFKIVVNSANPTDSISIQQLSRIFMKETTTWNSGQPVMPVDQAANSNVRQGFSKVILGRDTSAVKSYWQRLIFSGRGVPPPEKSSDEAVLDFVREHPGAVGYVSSGTDVGSGVKVLEIGKK